MLTIAIPKTDLPALEADGAQTKVNGEPVTMRLEGGYLCYHGEGQENRCKVLHREDAGENVHFFAASHGDEDEPHGLIGVGPGGEPMDMISGEQLAPPKPWTQVEVIYGEHTFACEINPIGVDEIIEKVDNHVKRKSVSIDDIRLWIKQTLENGDIDDDETKVMGQSLLWLACTGDDAKGSKIRQAAKEGATVIRTTISHLGGSEYDWSVDAYVRKQVSILPGLPGGEPLH